MGSKMFLGRVNPISEISATQTPNWLIDFKFLFTYLFYAYVCMYVCVCLLVCLCTTCVHCSRSQKKVLDPLRAGVMDSPDVGIMNEPWVPVKNSKSS